MEKEATKKTNKVKKEFFIKNDLMPSQFPDFESWAKRFRGIVSENVAKRAKECFDELKEETGLRESSLFMSIDNIGASYNIQELSFIYDSIGS